MARYMRIKNPGPWPRWKLFVIGASEKLEKWNDLNIRGQFGSATKFAPPAVLRFGLELHVASSDESGPYFLSYATEKNVRIPKPMVVARDRVTGGTTNTNHALNAFPAFSKPIGDDPLATFPFVREYVNNAFDERVESSEAVDLVDALEDPPLGWTHVYLGWHEDYQTILDYPERYLKHLAGVRPLAIPTMLSSKNGVTETVRLGAIYPKSEAGMTRLFSLGSLAHCSGLPEETSVFDYSFDRKDITDETRVFKGGQPKNELWMLLKHLHNADIAEAILYDALLGEAHLEVGATYLAKEGDTYPSGDTWLEAWKRILGDAVLSSDPQSDEIASTVAKRQVEKFRAQNFATFLKNCGVPDARSIIGGSNPTQGWIESEASEAERACIEMALGFVAGVFSDAVDVSWFLFEPLTETCAACAGFVQRHSDGRVQRRIGIRKDLVAEAVATGNDDAVLITLIHEYRHIRTGAPDADRAFEDAADQEVLLFAKPHFQKWKSYKQPKTPSA